MRLVCCGRMMIYSYLIIEKLLKFDLVVLNESFRKILSLKVSIEELCKIILIVDM